jgi:hypothetical protein
MAFHLLYIEGLPVTAVAATACYVPPTVEARHVHARRDVPIFWAVGEADVNRERLRVGSTLLRQAGAQVTVQRPRIGHVLDRDVGQAARSWFESVCRDQVEQTFVRAREDLKAQHPPYRAAVALEAIVRAQATHDPDQVSRATMLLIEVQRRGRQGLARAIRLLADDRPLEARAELLRIEAAYTGSSLALEARRRRLKIEAMPQVAAYLQAEQSEDRTP